jgi:hypothetical protein
VPDPDPEPLPPEGYDDRELPRQPDHDSPRCHVCNGPRALRHGVLFCRVCDAPPLT